MISLITSIALSFRAISLDKPFGLNSSILDNFSLSPFSEYSVQMAYPMRSLEKDKAVEVRSEIIK